MQTALCRVALVGAFLPGLQAGRLPPEIKGDKRGIMEPLCRHELQLFNHLPLLWSGAPVSELQQSHWCRNLSPPPSHDSLGGDVLLLPQL